MEPNTTKEFDWFDRPKVRKGLLIALWVICIITVLLQFTIPHDGHHHTHFGEHHLVPSYAILGFVACVAMILIAKGLGFILKRKDDYWGVQESETLPEDIDESIR